MCVLTVGSVRVDRHPCIHTSAHLHCCAPWPQPEHVLAPTWNMHLGSCTFCWACLLEYVRSCAHTICNSSLIFFLCIFVRSRQWSWQRETGNRPLGSGSATLGSTNVISLNSNMPLYTHTHAHAYILVLSWLEESIKLVTFMIASLFLPLSASLVAVPCCAIG